MSMRRLMLLRHAKSAWPAGMADHERPLAERGRSASLRMGRYMAGEGLLPDLVVISTARRAQETWELARSAFARDILRHDEPRVYGATQPAILAVVGETGADVRSLLLVGHNPGLQDLALQLIGKARQSDLARLRRKYPTAGLVVIDFDVERWGELSGSRGNLERFETPKSLGG
jgi:phosphohistidine phosphatase